MIARYNLCNCSLSHFRRCFSYCICLKDICICRREWSMVFCNTWAILITVGILFYSEWEDLRRRSGRNVPVLERWLQRRIHDSDLDMLDSNEHDTVLLSNPPSLTCKRYKKMKAYGNHWRVNDEIGQSMGHLTVVWPASKLTTIPQVRGKITLVR